MRAPDAELSERDRAAMVATLDGLVPRVLPADWRSLERYGNAAMFRSTDGLRVIASVERVDGEVWLHVSLSRADKIPNWHDMGRVKALFVGRDRKAVQVFPPESEHYNLHPYCLHLYHCVGRDPLPDFRDTEGRL